MFFFFSSRRRHTRYWRDWSSDVCSSDLVIFGISRMERSQNPGAFACCTFNSLLATRGGCELRHYGEAVRGERS